MLALASLLLCSPGVLSICNIPDMTLTSIHYGQPIFQRAKTADVTHTQSAAVVPTFPQACVIGYVDRGQGAVCAEMW